MNVHEYIVCTIVTAGKHFSNTNLSDLGIVGTCDIICLPNVSPNHVIHLIGWFKLVINLRHHTSLKPLFWPKNVLV